MAPATKVKPNDLVLAKAFKREVKKILGDNLVSVVLYGSRARGTANEESDMDILLLTKEEVPRSGPVDDALNKLGGYYLVHRDMLVTAIPYTVKKFENEKEWLPVLHWIEKEGVEV